MIPNVHLQRSLHLIKLDAGLRICQAWGPLIYYQKVLVIFVVLTFLKTKLMFTQEKNPDRVQQGFHPHCQQGMLEGDTIYALTSG